MTVPDRPVTPEQTTQRLRGVFEVARAALVGSAELNEGEPCWCPLWWWEEQTGPSDGEHTAHCDQQRALLDHIVEALSGNAR